VLLKARTMLLAPATIVAFAVASAAISVAAAAAAAPAPAAAALPLSELAKPGRVLMLRHANAPGSGDPPGFKLGECATQRNLDAAGRAQARALGAALRAALGKYANRTTVYASQWCRARETAELLGLGPPKAAPFLNSFYSDPSASGRVLAGLRGFLAKLPRDGPPVVFVTHQAWGRGPLPALDLPAARPGPRPPRRPPRGRHPPRAGALRSAAPRPAAWRTWTVHTCTHTYVCARHARRRLSSTHSRRLSRSPAAAAYSSSTAAARRGGWGPCGRPRGDDSFQAEGLV
jgi:hypothetical protein